MLTYVRSSKVQCNESKIHIEFYALHVKSMERVYVKYSYDVWILNSNHKLDLMMSQFFFHNHNQWFQNQYQVKTKPFFLTITIFGNSDQIESQNVLYYVQEVIFCFRKICSKKVKQRDLNRTSIQISIIGWSLANIL